MAQSTVMGTDTLPFFRYHPDPVATGSFRAGDEPCACCGRRAGWSYTAACCTAQDVDGPICPWCIADGSAAERFDAEFSDAFGLDGISEVGHTEPAARPEALDQVRSELRPGGRHDAQQLEQFLTHLGQEATAMLFRCTVCGTHLDYVDAS